MKQDFVRPIPEKISTDKILSDKIVLEDEIIFKTETIIVEDNNIELNYNGTHKTALDGGIIVKNGVTDDLDSKITTDGAGIFIVSPGLEAETLILPKYTPKNTNDENGFIGEVTYDDDYLYIKKNNGWGRIKLENF